MKTVSGAERTGGMLAIGALLAAAASAQHVVRAGVVHTMAGEAITDAVVVLGEDGTIEAVGRRGEVAEPSGYALHECAVAIPGLVDVRGTVGLTGMYNVDDDQDVLETADVMAPEMRAFDAFNVREPLVGYVRSLGVTTVHATHAPGELITGLSTIVKLAGNTVGEAVIVEEKAVMATLGRGALRSDGSPGTRGKQMAMLREELIKAEEYAEKRAKAAAGDGDQAVPDRDHDQRPGEPRSPSRDLGMEVLVRVLEGELPLAITAERMQDIASALRLADEFGFELWIDGCAECPGMIDEINDAGATVLLHPTMRRAWGETENQSYEAAKKLADEGVEFAIQSGYESYVPKSRVLTFEAGAAAGYGGLGFERALRAVTIDAARILGIDDRVGSIEVGKDADIAMFDGDPFEYTTHCVGTFIDGDLYPGETDYDIPYP